MGKPSLLIPLIQQHGFRTATTLGQRDPAHVLDNQLGDAICALYDEWAGGEDGWQRDTPETTLARDGQLHRILSQHWPDRGEYHESILDTLKNAWIQRKSRIKRARKKGSMSERKDRVFRSKQLAVQPPASAQPAPLLLPPTSPRPTLFWVFLEESFADICAEPTLSVDILEAEGSVLALHQWYSPVWAKQVRKELGPAFASLHDSSAVLHQNVVVMRALQHLYPTQVHPRPWTWLVKELQTPREVLPYLQQLSPVVVFLSHTATTTLCDTHVRKALHGLNKLRHLFGNQTLRTLPCEEELEHYHSKVADVRVLDSIAQTSPDVYAYRPRTCLGFTPCTLRDDPQTVFKRSHSDSGLHVQVKPQGVRTSLKCTPPTDSHRKTRRGPLCSQPAAPALPSDAGSLQPHWFHQKYISTRATVREFRVFIVAKKDDVLGGEVLHTVRTKTSEGLMSVCAADFDLFDHPAVTGLDRYQVEEFALYVYGRLRALRSPAYESLDIAARLYIAVAPPSAASPGRLFVLEVTRFYAAHFFCAAASPDPKCQACERVARAMGRFLYKPE
ncbi:hypothetical protein LTR56_020757 [Elasticomyces elasticus]|nr:hypothetical protein LTR56_020757 [Elasticomyces elasticus]KAK4909860.1 hypothetical protein LTR49_021400 [Elasticomyces elasticus]